MRRWAAFSEPSVFALLFAAAKALRTYDFPAFLNSYLGVRISFLWPAYMIAFAAAQPTLQTCVVSVKRRHRFLLSTVAFLEVIQIPRAARFFR